MSTSIPTATVDWPAVIAAIGLSDEKIARLAGCSRGAIFELRHRRTKDPAYRLGVKLIELRDLRGSILSGK